MARFHDFKDIHRMLNVTLRFKVVVEWSNHDDKFLCKELKLS